ncbi:hypothetical protein [Hydrogenophaga sp. PAMC20947]|uniref:hypothetical protein n=1 Tax=Hydrogenophaga sp. PAMC20947 TaxID=2565558 RepID=UPI00109E0B25|nr:hypothetical protein [Hydrogenophaga sp. PAMC20947]QCB45115.1 hypothetical protein E5678_03155 [Hydrogenophaga sp. PAMC20947]
MKAKRWMWIMWPAFLMAAVLEMLVFAFVDPSEMHWQGQSLSLSREAIYTGAFFIFWMATMLSSALTTLLAMSPFEVNRCPVPEQDRPRECAKNATCDRA